MKILDSLGAGGSSQRFYATDFNDDVVLLATMARPRRHCRGQAQSASAGGVSRQGGQRAFELEMSVKHGPVTLLSVAEDGKGGLKLVVAEGESRSGADSGDWQHNSRLPVLHRRAGVR